MTRWRIVSSAGVDLGTYPGETPDDALDALAREAGYRDRHDAAEVAGAFGGRVLRGEWYLPDDARPALSART